MGDHPMHHWKSVAACTLALGLTAGAAGDTKETDKARTESA